MFVRYLAILIVSACALGAQNSAEAVTKRTAYVNVRNETGQVITSLTVLHKYSDNYKNAETWGLLAPGKHTGRTPVQYHTGFGTTGKDWWLVSWTTEKDDRSFYLHYTNPNNFRGFIDGLEIAGDWVIPIGVAATTATACALAGCGPAAPLAAAGGAFVGKLITKTMLNSESTNGFKQHILRSEDDGQTVTISLHTNNRVVIRSPSGVSETSSTVKVMKANLPAETPQSSGELVALVAKHSGKCVDVSGVSQETGAGLHQWDCLGASQTNQVFEMRPVDGAYQLVARHSGKCIDVSGVSRETGAALHQWDCLGAGQTNQLFDLRPVGAAYQIVARHSGKCLDVRGPSYDNGAVIQQWDCVGASQTNQLFELRKMQ